MNDSSNRSSYHVQWYIDAGGIREDVTLEIEHEKLVQISAGKSDRAISLGPVAVIAGLVNAHTHLEFSLLKQPFPTAGRFTDWIRTVVNYRRSHSEVVSEAIHAGITESVKSGTTLIGDIATSGWSDDNYASAEFEGVVYQELIGLSLERIASQSDLATSLLSKHASSASSFQLGLSPHAPYSVHPDLFQFAVDQAVNAACPLAMHLAETPAELELLSQGTGEFREMLSEFGIWRDRLFGGLRPLDYLKRLSMCPRALVVHGNYLDERELQFLASNPNMTLVYCPRTHAAFGHAPHPWRRLLELGGSVAIGTDSRASNPDLSLFAELQFLAQQEPGVSHLELLKLGTESGRLALTGSPTSNSADFCIVRWQEPASAEPERNLFAPENRIAGTMIRGRWSYVQDPVQRTLLEPPGAIRIP